MFRRSKPPETIDPAQAASACNAPTPTAEPAAPEAFDADWYARHRVHGTQEPFSHYMAEGHRAARSPCLLFSPAWYLAANPDVAVSRAEPLAHYVTHGWREGRDPSPLFSTRHYLAAAPQLLEEGEDPLTHYRRVGRAKGLAPHPRIRPFAAEAPDIALVIVYAGDASALDLTLWALKLAGGGLPLTIYLVDSAGQGSREALDRLAQERSAPGFAIRRHCELEGEGFACCANAGFWAALRETCHTHIALLEQAVLVPPGLLEDLVDLWAPAAVPVLNVADTEQAVPVEHDIYATAEPLKAVSDAAASRRAAIAAAVSLADRVEPAVVLFERASLEAAGFLDDRAETRADALAPLLEGLRAAGLGCPLIARHLYAHRLERSPVVSAPPVAALVRRPGVSLPQGMEVTPRALAALHRSAEADRAGIMRWTNAMPGLLKAHTTRYHAMAAALTADLGASGEKGARNPKERPGRELLAGDTIAFGDPPTPPRMTDPASLRRRLATLQWQLVRYLGERERLAFDAVIGLQPMLATIAALADQAPPVLVLTMDTDPVTGDEKDGYVQRVIAIDRAIEDRERVYLKMVEARDGRPALVHLGRGIWRIEIAHGCEIGEAVLASLLATGAPVYSQSLVGIDPPVIRRLLPSRTGPFVMDMHGSVPEEFALYQNHHLAQKYARHEIWAAEEADHIVCVTEAMATHFETKLGVPRARMIVCPIFLHARSEPRVERAYHDRPRVIYAGGTQRWQMIPELAALVAETHKQVDWVLFTPDVDGLAAALATEGVAPDGAALTLGSATQAQVFATYPRCDFGLLLREDCVVNRVACPTKLVEYLRFGVIPVLSTSEVGDFVALGMRWVSAADFAAGRLPDPEKRAEMAAANAAVFCRLLDASALGLSRIARAVARAPDETTVVTAGLRSTA